MTWATDRYRPSDETALGAFDNYEIYDLIVSRYASNITTTTYYNGLNYWDYRNAVNPTIEYYPQNPPDDWGGQLGDALVSTIGGTSGAYYRFSEYVGTLDMGISHPGGETIASTVTQHRGKIYALQRWHPQGAIDASIIENLLEEYPHIPSSEGTAKIVFRDGQESAGWLVDSHRSWEDLIMESIVFTGIAQTSGTFEISYWGINTLEAHPLIDKTIDYRRQRLRLIKGKPFKLKLWEPIAHTLLAPSPLLGATSGGLLLSDILATSRQYLNSLPPTPLPSSPPIEPPLKGFTLDQWTKWGLVYNAALNIRTVLRSHADRSEFVGRWVQKQIVTNNQWRGFKVLRAGNMGIAQSTWADDASDADIPTTTADLIQRWHFQPQTEQSGQYGDIKMDSVTTLMIWERVQLLEAALDGERYAIDPDDPDGGRRVANLGWMIEKIGNILGIRRKPNGNFLAGAEKAAFDRTRLPNPTWPKGAYDSNSWGDKGYALRYLPTAYENGKRQDNQYDMVHDLPQMIEALLDQIDHGQGLQHTAEIRIKVGGKVQSYANIGQLTIDLMTRVMELEAMMEKATVMAIETSNSVRELFPAIGIPVTTKSVIVEMGGKKQHVYYPAFQAGKGSIRDVLGAISQNIGIMFGQMMPGGKQDARLNPLNRGKK